MNRFSRTFYKFVDAALDISPEDRPIDNYFRSSADYEQSLRDYARFNHLRVGSFVAVYEDTNQSRFLAYGCIRGMEWHEDAAAYKYEIEVCQSGVGAVLHSWSFHLREVDPSEIRQLFTAVRQ